MCNWKFKYGFSNYSRKFSCGRTDCHGKAFNTFPGGKGGNQAIALGRLGSDVLMVGKIGEDMYGKRYLEVLRSNNVKSDGVSIEKACFLE